MTMRPDAKIDAMLNTLAAVSVPPTAT